MGLLLMGSLLPTPLFLVYRSVFHLGPAEVSLVLTIYMVALIPSLLFLGGLSDRIGRQHAILIAFGLSALASLLFACATGLWWLLAGRALQGIAVGIGSGAAAAAIREWSRDQDSGRASIITVVTAGVGATTGTLLGGLLAQVAPNPLVLPYYIHIALLACGAVAILTVPPCACIYSAALTPSIRIPRPILRAFMIASLQSAIGSAGSALFVGIVPSYLSSALGSHDLLIGTSVILAIQIGSMAALLGGHRLSMPVAIVIALAASAASLWAALGAVVFGLGAPLAGLGSLIAGAGAGLSYYAGLKVVNDLPADGHRAQITSGFLVIGDLGFIVPAMGVGLAAGIWGLGAALAGAAVILSIISVVLGALAKEQNLAVNTA
jgi:MFS family permease